MSCVAPQAIQNTALRHSSALSDKAGARVYRRLLKIFLSRRVPALHQVESETTACPSLCSSLPGAQGMLQLFTSQPKHRPVSSSAVSICKTWRASTWPFLSGRSACKPQLVRAAKEHPAHSLSGPIVVVDNYDSFTYNLCQVNGRPLRDQSTAP